MQLIEHEDLTQIYLDEDQEQEDGEGGTRAGSSIEDETHRTLRQWKWTRRRR